MKQIMQLLTILTPVLLFSSCKTNTESPAEKATPKVIEKVSVITDTTISKSETNAINDVALYLAGMTTASTTAIPKTLVELPSYKTFCDTMNRGFANIENKRLSKMREWASTELKEELAHPKTVFYPFSGPDILHCVNLYPDADQYVMVALEKYGSMPDMSKMDASKANSTLSSITKSLEDIFGKSYFITRKMLRDVSNQWNGFTPLVAVFLTRANYIVLDVKYKHLNEDGTMKEITKDACGTQNNDLVEIYFKKKASEKIQKVVYFRTNLCNDPYGGMPSFTENKALQNYFNGLPECYTYVKSASYLMNYETFSIIRNICLAKSKSILQDDTGIAYRYIDKTKWNVKLYGNYVKPVSDFSGVFQNDLHAAYTKDSSKVQKLPFSLGYHWANQTTQNLMKFEKK